MEIGLANLIEPGDRVLILESGVFAGRFKTIAERNGAEVRIETAPLGDVLDLDRVRQALEAFRPKVVTITHVDTSTGVRLDVEPLARLAREHDALVVVDGVCSIGGEEFHGDDWGVDLAFTASQKAIGAPPGLALLTVGPRARAARENRRALFPGYFTDIANWLPVMEGYEAGTPGYFGTPAVTLLTMLHTALEEVVGRPDAGARGAAPLDRQRVQGGGRGPGSRERGGGRGQRQHADGDALPGGRRRRAGRMPFASKASPSRRRSIPSCADAASASATWACAVRPRS